MTRKLISFHAVFLYFSVLFLKCCSAVEFKVIDKLSVDGRSLFRSTVTVVSQSSQTYSLGVQNPAGDFVLYITTTGEVGIGTSDPTAVLHLKAGTTGPGGAPIKLVHGELLAAPEDGAMEYANSHLYFTIGTNRIQIAGGGVAVITVRSEGPGSGVVTSTPAGVNCGATCSGFYTPLTQVTLTAMPNAGSIFTGWSGDCTGSNNACTISVSGVMTAIPTFGGYYLSLARSGVGGGTVTSNDSLINCGSTCGPALYTSGGQVTLTASPNPGSSFAGWSGATNGTCASTPSVSPCYVTMSSSQSVTAAFGNNLTMSKSGPGGGTVTSDDSSINCGSSCGPAVYTSATQVTLTASPNPGSGFTGWSGATNGTCASAPSVSPCYVTMSSSQAVTASFGTILTVTKSGVGSGTVTSNDSVINCGSSCGPAVYQSAGAVTLTATADSGSVFSGWSGDCSGTGTCSLTMNAAHSVTAAFRPAQSVTQISGGTCTGTNPTICQFLTVGSGNSIKFGITGAVQALVVAGGGGGGTGGGGGGAGGLLYDAAHSVTGGQSYGITVGDGGNGSIGNSQGSNGGNSIFDNMNAIGGGGGGYANSVGSGGGSGGGGAKDNSVAGGAGTSGQGHNGGTSGASGGSGGGGGGGAGAAGGNGGTGNETGGAGGAGLSYSISGTAPYYAGGGGGAANGSNGGAGGSGGGGNGGTSGNGYPGTANTGGGGGAGRYSSYNGGKGGSGIVIINFTP